MLSIAVCTYNRAEQLTVLLDQFIGFSDWLNEHAELIIIDNNSSDHTQELLASYQQKINLRIFCEMEQGLAAARNRAINEFNGDAILFLDDDVTVSLRTFESYCRALKEHGNIDFLGGKIIVDWQGATPQWLKSDDLVLLNGLFGKYDLGDENIEYSDQMAMPFGANFVLRRKLINSVGLFDVRLGVIGQQIGRGEETDYFKRAVKLGFSGLYCARAEVGHRFQKERVNIPYLYRYGFEKGRAAYLIDHARSTSYLARSFGFFIRGLYQLLKGRRDRFYQCVINIGIMRGVYTESMQR